MQMTEKRQDEAYHMIYTSPCFGELFAKMRSRVAK